MAYLPLVKPNALIRTIQKKGFIKDRQSGNHAIFVHPDGRWTSIPVHNKTIGKGLLRKILRDVHLTPEKLKEIL